MLGIQNIKKRERCLYILGVSKENTFEASTITQKWRYAANLCWDETHWDKGMCKLHQTSGHSQLKQWWVKNVSSAKEAPLHQSKYEP